MDEMSRVYVVTVNIENEKYYLASLAGIISKNISDSLIFPNENLASFYATRMEFVYQDSLGKAESTTFREVL